MVFKKQFCIIIMCFKIVNSLLYRTLCILKCFLYVVILTFDTIWFAAICILNRIKLILVNYSFHNRIVLCSDFSPSDNWMQVKLFLGGLFLVFWGIFFGRVNVFISNTKHFYVVEYKLHLKNFCNIHVRIKNYITFFGFYDSLCFV